MGIILIASVKGKPAPRFAAIRSGDGWKYTKAQVDEMEKRPCPNITACKKLSTPPPIPKVGRDSYRRDSKGRNRPPRTAFNNNMLVPSDLRKKGDSNVA